MCNKGIAHLGRVSAAWVAAPPGPVLCDDDPMAETDASTTDAATEVEADELPDSIPEALKAPVRKPEEVAEELAHLRTLFQSP